MICDDCVFCKSNLEIISENEFALSFYDKYPVTKHHMLIISKRHISNYFELNTSEIGSMQELLFEQKERLIKEDSSITGFNIGINIGEDSGQTVFHVHMHLIPRRKGDMENPKGGVRGVIPEKQKY